MFAPKFGYAVMTTSTDGRQGKRRRRSAPQGARPYAALDLGTNNCRLLVACPTPSGRLKVIDSHSQVVRLGEGLAHSGRLSDAAMERAVSALEACIRKAKRHRPVRSKYIATQACRAADNGRDFLARVRKQLGIRLEAITGKQEAKFALLGSLDLIDKDKDFAAVIDIGGGSTEVCFVDARSAVSKGVKGCAARPPILGWASFPFGVVTLTESYAHAGPAAYDRMVEHVRTALEANDASSRFGPLFASGRGQLVGNSGTVTSLTAVSLGLRKYVRAAVDGVWLERAAAATACERLVAASAEQRAQEPCIGPERAELIVAGCAILDAIWEVWPAARMRVGDRGLREGMLMSMIHEPPKPRSNRTARSAVRGAGDKAAS